MMLNVVMRQQSLLSIENECLPYNESLLSIKNAYLTKPVEYVVEKGQNRRSSDFYDVVKRLTSVVTNSTVRIKETRQDRLNQVVYVIRRILQNTRETKYRQERDPTKQKRDKIQTRESSYKTKER